MRNEDLDHLLSKEADILPSSGFVASVMDAVQQQITTPPPMAFPWTRVLPGLLATLVALAATFVFTFKAFARGTGIFPPPWMSAVASMLQIWKTVDGNWITAALLLSFALVKLSPLFVARKGMAGKPR